MFLEPKENGSFLSDLSNARTTWDSAKSEDSSNRAARIGLDMWRDTEEACVKISKLGHPKNLL